MTKNYALPSFLLLLLFIGYSPVWSQNIPIDFESGGNGAMWNWTVFENDSNPALEIVANPDPTGANPSATVAKFTALQAGQPFAGVESLHGAGIGSFTIDSTNMIINIMVWKPTISDVGIKLVRFDNWSLGEIKKMNTTVNQWEQISFDFSAHMGNTYDQIVIFPDFNARSADNVIYFDNVYGPEYVATGIKDEVNFDVSLYPNPANTACTLRASENMEALRVINMVGKVCANVNSPGQSHSFDLSAFPAGVYFVEAKIRGETFRKKLIKQ